jgi:hypothetical protein
MRAKRPGANGNRGETTQRANRIRGETTRYRSSKVIKARVQTVFMHRRLCSQKYARYVPKIPQGRTHSYYPCHFNLYFPCQNVDRTQIAY